MASGSASARLARAIARAEFHLPSCRGCGGAGSDAGIRRRLHLDYAERDALTAALDHLLDAAGNGAMMTTELKATLAEHAAGNFRILMNLADDLMTIGYERQLPQLNEDLFLDVFHPPAQATRKKKPARRKR